MGHFSKVDGSGMFDIFLWSEKNVEKTFGAKNGAIFRNPWRQITNYRCVMWTLCPSFDLTALGPLYIPRASPSGYKVGPLAVKSKSGTYSPTIRRGNI